MGKELEHKSTNSASENPKLDDHATRKEVEGKITFPQIHKRPPFWVEFFIVMVGSYLAGIASIYTYEHWRGIIGALTFSVGFVLGIVMSG